MTLQGFQAFPFNFIEEENHENSLQFIWFLTEYSLIANWCNVIEPIGVKFTDQNKIKLTKHTSRRGKIGNFSLFLFLWYFDCVQHNQFLNFPPFHGSWPSFSLKWHKTELSKLVNWQKWLMIHNDFKEAQPPLFIKIIWSGCRENWNKFSITKIARLRLSCDSYWTITLHHFINCTTLKK